MEAFDKKKSKKYYLVIKVGRKKGQFMQKEAVNIYVLDIKYIMEHEKDILSILEEGEISKARSFGIPIDYYHSLGSSYFKNLFEVETSQSCPLGAKTHNGLYYNISHSGEYVVASLCKSPVGIDIESIQRFAVKNNSTLPSPALIDRILSEDERQHIKTAKDLCRAWTIKESIVKCQRTGIDRPLKNVVAVAPYAEYNGKKYYTQSIDYSGYVMSVTVQADGPFTISTIKTIGEKAD